MYGGEIELFFDSYKHHYTINKKEVFGVTDVLKVINKPALMFWAANMAADHFRSQIVPGKAYDEIELEAIWKESKRAHTAKKESAGSLGTLVHKWVEAYCANDNPPMPVNEEAIGGIKRFLEWVEKHHVKFLSNEQPCYSKKYNYAGTIDGICQIDGKMYIFDLKTSSGIWDEYLIQVAAYKQARQEEFPNEKYAGCVILRVGKEDGDLDFFTFKDKKYHLGAFLYALELKKALALIEKDKK